MLRNNAVYSINFALVVEGGDERWKNIENYAWSEPWYITFIFPKYIFLIEYKFYNALTKIKARIDIDFVFVDNYFSYGLYFF